MPLIGSRFSSWFPDVDDGAAPAARRLNLNPHPLRRFRGQPRAACRACRALCAMLSHAARPCSSYIYTPCPTRLFYHSLCVAPFLPNRRKRKQPVDPSCFPTLHFSFLSPSRQYTHQGGFCLVLILFSPCLATWVSLPKRVAFWGIYLLPLVPRARFRCCSCSSLCLSPRTPLLSVATEDQRSPSRIVPGTMDDDVESQGVRLRAGKIRSVFNIFSAGSMIGTALLYPMAHAGGLGLKAV